MNEVANAPAVPVPSVGRPRERLRLFYFASACLMLLITLVGFQQFYLHGKAHPGRDIAPPIKTLVIVHGLAMTGWVLLFLVQSFLITTKRHRVHMQLGRAAAAFAIVILVSGVMLSIESTRLAPPGFVIWSMSARQFMAVPFFGIWLFAGMVGVGVYYRRRSEIHRPMMLFATLSALAAATGRIEAVNAVYQGTVWERVFGPFLIVLIVGAVLVFLKWALTRTFDKWFAISYAVIFAAFLLTIQIARTPAWEKVVVILVG